MKVKYFDGKVNAGFTAILVSRSMLFIVNGLLAIFAPLFVYKLFGESVQLAILFYGIASLLYVLFLSFGVRFVDKIGFRRSLQVSAFLGAIYYLTYYLAEKEVLGVMVFAVSALVMLTIFRTFYWVPFHTEFTLMSDKKNRGRQVSIFRASALFMGIFLPFVSAYLIEQVGFGFVFAIAIGLFIASSIPYRFMPVIPETYSWGYLQTWKEFAHHGKTRVAASFVAQGAENIIALFLWPIFLYEIFNGNLMSVGGVSTLIIAVSVVLQLFVGKHIDKFGKSDKVLEWGGYLYAVGWIVKIFVLTTFHVFVVGVYHSLSQIFAFTSVNKISYDLLEEQEEYVDEYTVLREMYVNLGRFLSALIVVALSYYFELKWLFIVAAVATLIFHLISDRDLDLKSCKQK